MRIMAALLLALVALAPVATAHAQTFPAPGTGVFTWERVGDRPLNAASFSFAPSGRLVAADDSVWVYAPMTGSTAGQWEGRGRPGGIVAAVLALDPDGDTLLVGHGNGGLLSRSVDGGATWRVVNGSLSGTVVGGPETPDGFFVLPPGHAHDGRLLAGGVSIYSDNRGASWTEAPQGVPPNARGFGHVFAALPSGRVLMGSTMGAAASDDGGATYAVTPLWGSYRFDGMTALSTPGSVQTGAPSCGLADGALCDGAVAVGYSTLLPDIRAWRTADGGRTWSESVPLPEPNDGVGNGYTAGVVALPSGPDGLGRAITVLGRGVVYATHDGGQTWEVIGRMPVRLGGPSHYTRLVRLGPDGHLWVSTFLNAAAGEWVYRSAERADAAFAVAGEVGPDAAAGVDVSVSPNPARGRVEIAVTLAEAGPVRIAVMDALGREVAVVLDGAAGAGETVKPVETTTWPAGVYVVCVTAGAQTSTTRLVVAR